MAKSDNAFRLKVTLDAEKGGVHVEVIERETEKVTESHFFSAREIHQNVRTDVALYGYSKLLQDRTSENPAGPGKVEAMKEVAALLQAGVWEKERKVGAPVISPEVEALAEIYGKTVAEIQTALKGYSADQKKEIFAKPRVVEAAKAIRERRATATEAPSLDLSALG